MLAGQMTAKIPDVTRHAMAVFLSAGSSVTRE
jgi:hypothetical protein